MRRTNTQKHSEIIIDFGNRKISNQNFSKIVALPKQALSNCGLDTTMKVNVRLVQNGKEKFLKLSPVCEPKEATS